MLFRSIADSLHLAWDPIFLNQINGYLIDWYNAMGVTTHAHGMYHLDFYSQIKEIINNTENITIVSGIDGDLWAGSSPSVEVRNPFELLDLNYAHGISISTTRTSNEVLEKWFDNHVEQLKSEAFRTLTLIRNKNMLNRYLYEIPNSFNLGVWSPFADMKLCIAMLNLDPARRKDRIWQREHFSNTGLPYGDSSKSPFRYNQDIDLRAFLQHNLEHIDVTKLPSDDLKLIGIEVNNTLNNVANRPLFPILNSLVRGLGAGVIKFASSGTVNAAETLGELSLSPRLPKFRDAHNKWSILHPLTVRWSEAVD